ncbi:MAG: HDOD domain-containing protein, partial [Candidatus Delongbacteria bacterium]|nr:HDOD domain-containing protein [Candidatus Delongbacteria bacterium]
MNIKEIINNSEAEYFIPKIVNDFIRLADNGKLTKTSFIELVSKKYSYEKQILSYFAKCINKDINSLTEAINKLGIVECAFAIFNISLLEQLSKNDHESFSQMFEKGIFTAVSCYYLAKKANMRSPWKAYLSGLYSNISYFFLYKHFPDEFNDLMSNNSNSVSRMNFEWETFGVTHSDISWMIMDKAGIPDDIMEPVKVHHIKKAQTSFKKGDRKNFSPAIYLGSMLTTILYENHSLAVNFKLEIEKYFDLKIDDVDNLISNIVTDLKTKLDLLDINNTYFKGYFSLIYHSNNEMKNISLKLKEAKSELNKEKKQRLKFQKVLES